MHRSFARTLTSLALALALIVGGALHGAMASGMAGPIDGPAVSQLEGDRCGGCGSSGDAASGADCLYLCVNQVGVVPSSTLPADVDGRVISMPLSVLRTGLAAPPEPSPPKHHLG